MIRAPLTTKRRIGQGPRLLARWIPAISVICAILLHALPIVSTSGWYPEFGYLTLIAWRLLRADPWPGWWAAPMGLINDLVIGHPVGMSVFFWSASILLLDLLDRRTMWRDYWIEWLLAALLLLATNWIRWRVLASSGADLPLMMTLPSFLISIFVFPIVAWIVAGIDRWRLRR